MIPLHAYQRAFLLDRARLKGWVKSRQIGGSFTGSLDMIDDMVVTGSDWNTMSRTGRQAKKLLEKAVRHVEAYDAYARHQLRMASIIEKITSEEIVLTNGAVANAMPCDPDTTVGDTVSWFLDEVGLYLNDRTYGTIKPSIMHGKRIVMASTPRGRQGKWPQLFKNWQDYGSEKTGWSFHVTTIEQAIAGGLKLIDHNGQPISFERFKQQEILDIGMEMWLQEYMCQFLDSISAFLPHEDIIAASIPDQPLERTLEMLAQDPRPLFMGVDFGRFKDWTVIWIGARNPDGTYETACIIPMQQTPFPQQKDRLVPFFRHGIIERAAIDATGPGIPLGDEFVQAFGSDRVLPVTFTNANKNRMAERVRSQLASRALTMPEDDDIIEDFANIERIITEHGNVRIAARGGGKTHGDFFWACGLMLEAATDYDALDGEPPIAVSRQRAA